MNQYNGHNISMKDNMKRQKRLPANRFCLLILMMAFMLIMPAVPAFAQSKPLKHVTAETKYIMIGDSYSVQPAGHPEKNWPNQLYKKLNMDVAEVCLLKRCGYGFVGKRHRKAFIDLVKPLESSPNIQAVIIAGGLTNDIRFSDRRIRKAFRQLNAMLKDKYPNARIYYGAINWKKDKAAQKKIIKRKILYYRYCRENDWVYLPRTHDAIAGHKHCLKKDKHHPTVAGVNRIVQAMYEDLKGYFPLS